MILTTQICINLAFTEVVSEEVIKRAKATVEEEGFKMLSLVVVVNGSSLVVVNGRDCELSISSLSLYCIDGNVVDVEVNWSIPRGSVSAHQLPEISEMLTTCIAIGLTFKEGNKLLLPLSRV
ncbi:hypothetical protein DSO06_02915 [Candidatus Nezhaarchaeota archaeon WYZ-LMO8]|nr:MAG: hypothetical protein DSO06_02915 [Candidatus Nezhaarchaeota archaeon WYZ-LMO8]TDA37289.1 MAG: hypothetical protein DSO05_00865 [Candidatus Nezhaarchaeota archaeon WYZ-LMO7]